MADATTTHTMAPVIALIQADETLARLFAGDYFSRFTIRSFSNGMAFYAHWEKHRPEVAIIVSRSEIMAASGISLLQALEEKELPPIPFIIITRYINDNLQQIAMRAGVSDIFTPDVTRQTLERRVAFLIANWQTLHRRERSNKPTFYRTPFPKRLFDVLFSLTALVLLSPFFLLIILALKLESRGPAFYYSFRVGTGYRVFKLFKFRSMFVDAERQVNALKHLNAYNQGKTVASGPGLSANNLCNECRNFGMSCRLPLYADQNAWCEKLYFEHRKMASHAAFFKLADDPRVSRVGRILRKTSLDELPQLINVLKGEMSIVGNRPLPLYEAERLTTDRHALRFMAPAGITGLWQVKNRGKILSEEERLLLDNSYARDHSFLKDLWLILMTIPAMFQSENS